MDVRNWPYSLTAENLISFSLIRVVLETNKPMAIFDIYCFVICGNAISEILRLDLVNILIVHFAVINRFFFSVYVSSCARRYHPHNRKVSGLCRYVRNGGAADALKSHKKGVSHRRAPADEN